MTRQQLTDAINIEIKAISEKFAGKNASYGGDQEGLYNFSKTAQRFYGEDGLSEMFRIAHVFMDKHLVTLAKNGINDAECADRLQDVIVYSLIMLAMRREHDANGLL